MFSGRNRKREGVGGWGGVEGGEAGRGEGGCRQERGCSKEKTEMIRDKELKGKSENLTVGETFAEN